MVLRVTAALTAALVAVLGLTAWAVGPHPAPVPATRDDVAFVVALRTFESQSASLADQAAAQSSSARIRSAALELGGHARHTAAGLWALLDEWRVPGLDRLPPLAAGLSSGAVAPSNPTAGLRHACGLVAADELGRLAAMSGRTFDETFVRDWVDHAQSALVALRVAPKLGVVGPADRLLHRDIAVLAAAI